MSVNAALNYSKIIEQTVCLVIYETKEIPDSYFSNQTRFDLKRINGI